MLSMTGEYKGEKGFLAPADWLVLVFVFGALFWLAIFHGLWVMLAT
jgi:hypothetical protein